MSRPVFRAEPLPAGDVVTLAGPEGRHAQAVLRMRPGELVEIVDGTGGFVVGTVAMTRPGEIDVEVGERGREAPSPVRFVLVQALAKGERGELAVELATEVGVDVIVPWRAARCVVRWDGARGQKALGRWRATAAAAAKQARRRHWPTVADPCDTARVAELLAAAALPVVLHEEATEPLAAVTVPATGDVVLVVGPEGGIAPEELAALAAPAYRLGREVLRTSSAGPVAAAVLAARTARWLP